MTNLLGLRCLQCNSEHHLPVFDGCPKCRNIGLSSNLVPIYKMDEIRKSISQKELSLRKPGVWSFKELLPVEEKYIVSLGEGGTPLIKCDTLGQDWGINLYVKDESRNPTYSFKDRLATVSISKARELGVSITTIASTGNHGAAVAAYSAKAGMECIIFTSENVPKTMKTLMQIYGAKVFATSNPADRWRLMREGVEKYGWYPVGNYVSPPVGSNFFGIEGYKTIAYEICLDLNWNVPDIVVQPTCYGDGLSGIWRGFKDFYELGFIDKLPRMVSAERFGSLKNALDNRLEQLQEMKKEPTIAFSIGSAISASQSLITLRESKGYSKTVNDNELIEMQKTLGRVGIYAEASSLASLVAIKKMCSEGTIKSNATVVAVITSTGLKDSNMTAAHLPEVPIIEPNLASLAQVLAAN